MNQDQGPNPQAAEPDESHYLHFSSKNLGRSSRTSIPTTVLPGAAQNLQRLICKMPKQKVNMLNLTAVKVAMKVPKGNKFSSSCLDRATSCITQTLVSVLCARPIRKKHVEHVESARSCSIAQRPLCPFPRIVRMMFCPAPSQWNSF